MKTYQNLLPPEFQQRLLISVRLRQWCKIWALTVLALLAFGLQEYAGSHQLQQRWDALNQRAAPIVQTKLENDAFAKQLTALDEKIALIEGVNDAKNHLALIGIISHSARNTGKSIQIQACTFQELAPVAANKSNAAQPQNQPGKPKVPIDEKTMKVDLRGLAVDEHSIARFIKTLKKIEAFNHVELKTVRGTGISNQSFCTYQIECAL